MKVFLSVLMFFAVLLAASTVEATQAPYTKELDNRISTIESSVTTAESDIDTAESDIDDLEAGITACGGSTETSSDDAGALSVVLCQSLISSAGSESRTLAAPTAGQYRLKVIRMSVDGGAVTLAATNIGNLSGTCTFDDVGDSILLMSDGLNWISLGEVGVTCE